MSQSILTGTLVDQVIQYRNHEDARNGINLDKLARQRKETVLMAIASNKRYTSGLHHVAAGRYLLGPEVVDDQLKRKKHAEEVQRSERENRKIDMRTWRLQTKVMQSDRLTNSQLCGQ